MAGGEFRFGTASIYMAKGEPIRCSGTNHDVVITWPRSGCCSGHSARTFASLVVSARGKLGLGSHVERHAPANRPPPAISAPVLVPAASPPPASRRVNLWRRRRTHRLQRVDHLGPRQ